MPQQDTAAEERRKRLEEEMFGGSGQAAPQTPAPTGTVEPAPRGMGALEQFLRINETGLAGAVGGLRGGLPGVGIGAASGIIGGALDPASSHEQAAASLVSGPMGNATKILPVLARMAATGAAAGGVRAARTGDVNAGVKTGLGAAAGEGVGSLLAPMVSGLGRLGAMMETGNIGSKVRDVLGPKLKLLTMMKGDDSVEAALGRITLAASNTGSAPHLETLIDNTLFKSGNIATVTNRIFSNPKRVRELVKTAAPEDTERLLNHFIDENVLGAKVRSKGASLVPEGPQNILQRLKDKVLGGPSGDYQILNGKEATAVLQGLKDSGAYEALSAPLKKKVDTVFDIVSRIDPTEALKSEERLASLASKILVSGSVRGAAGQRNVVAGTGAGLIANQTRKLTNPEVAELIRRASRGELEAVRTLVRGAGIGTTRALTPTPAEQLNNMP